MNPKKKIFLIVYDSNKKMGAIVAYTFTEAQEKYVVLTGLTVDTIHSIQVMGDFLG